MKNQLPGNINLFLNQFPNNAKTWADATDEVRDLARTARIIINQYDYSVDESDFENGVKPLNFKAIKTPSEWNTQGKLYIQKVYSDMSPKSKLIFEETFNHLFSNN